MDHSLRNFIELCLQIDSRKRPIPEDLLKHELFKNMSDSPVDEFNEYVFLYCANLRIDNENSFLFYLKFRHREKQRTSFEFLASSRIVLSLAVGRRGCSFGIKTEWFD